jgi:hypothetical protein
MEEYVIILPTEMFNTLQHNPQFKITGFKRLLFNKIMRVLKYKKGIQNMAMNYEGVLCQFVVGRSGNKNKIIHSMKNN